MTSVTEMADVLREEVAWQKTPELLELSDYEKLIINAIKRLFIDTGRASQFSASMIHPKETESDETTEEDTEIESDEATSPEIIIDYDFMIDEERYVFLCAQIGFLKRVQLDVNNIVSYTTNALSITSADKPYAHLQDSIAELEKERRIVYYKMVRYTIYSAGE